MYNINLEEIAWEKIAADILEKEKVLGDYNFTEHISVLIKWKNEIYMGWIHQAVPEFSEEIVLLSKTSFKLPDELVNQIRKLDKNRLELYVDESIDLEGRLHVMRRAENKLVLMDREQIEYMIEHLPHIYESAIKY